MKIDRKTLEALHSPDTEAVAYEMTPERKKRFSRVSGQVIDLLRANTKGPVEAYMLLTMIQRGFEESYGIRGGFSIANSDDPA